MNIESYRVYILALIALLLIAAVGWYSWRQLQRNRHQQQLHAVISRLGVERLRDAVLPDGLDGLVFIDYLILTPSGIVVIDLMHSEGHLFGGNAIDQWSQVVKHRTYKFSNPLYAHETKCQAIAWHQKNLQEAAVDAPPSTASPQAHDIRGWVVFSNAGDFPKGMPTRVCMIDALPDKLTPLDDSEQSVSAELRRLWDHLHNLSVTTRAALPRNYQSH